MREILIMENNDSSPLTQLHNAASVINNPLKDEFSLIDLRVSVEISPGKSFDGLTLSRLPCSFCSVTWRTPSAKELENVEKIPAIVLSKKLRSCGYNVLLHLAGRNLRRYQVLKILDVVKDAGIRNLLALQGDPSQIKEKDDKKCDFPYAADLVSFIRRCYGDFFTIGVAAYPEKHPKSENLESDFEYLKYKISCGADFILTQACYNYSTFATFVLRCRNMDIRIPIIPGILIISSYKSMLAISNFCGIPIPTCVLKIVKGNEHNDAAVREFGRYQCCQLIKMFLKNRKLFGGIHVFTLNDLELLKSVLSMVELCTIERPLRLKNNKLKYICIKKYIE